jgi:hypothetical protein
MGYIFHMALFALKLVLKHSLKEAEGKPYEMIPRFGSMRIEMICRERTGAVE